MDPDRHNSQTLQPARAWGKERAQTASKRPPETCTQDEWPGAGSRPRERGCAEVQQPHYSSVFTPFYGKVSLTSKQPLWRKEEDS